MTGSFEVGDRVRIEGHLEFEDGILGTVQLPDPSILKLSGPQEWDGCR